MSEMPVEAENGNVSSNNSKSMQHRHSLQHNSLPSNNLRHTQSYRYDKEGRKKMKKAIVLSPVILEGPENENEYKSSVTKPVPKIDQFTMENEKRSSRSSKKSDKSVYAFDNAAYEGNSDKRSISSRAGTSRQPSVQSLEVVREQYCCCAKRTRCEKKLLVTVTVLSVVIIVLVVVLTIVAADKHDVYDFKNLLNIST